MSTSLIAPAAPPERQAQDGGEAGDPREAVLKAAPEALGALVFIMRHGTSEAARIAAANAILDRALGKPRAGGEAAEERRNLPPLPKLIEVRFV